MRTSRLKTAFVAALVIAAGTIAACSSDDNSTSCTPNETQACSTSQCNGFAVCASDGKSYGACQCTGGSGTTSDGGTNG